MREQPRFLGQIANRPHIQGKRRRKELPGFDFDVTIVRFLNSGNAGKDCALARARSAKQADGVSLVEFQRDIYRQFSAFFDDPGLKHDVDAVPARESATGAGEQRRRTLPATASPRAGRSSANSPKAVPAFPMDSRP